MPISTIRILALLLLGSACERPGINDGPPSSIRFVADHRLDAWLGSWQMPDRSHLSIGRLGSDEATLEVSDAECFSQDVRRLSFDGQTLRFELVSWAKFGANSVPHLWVAACSLTFDGQYGQLLLVRDRVRASFGSEEDWIDAAGFAETGVLLQRMAN